MDKVEEVESFLWELFEIDWRSNIRKAERIDSLNSKNYINKYMLNQYFIYRFYTDPGFKQFLISEIEKKPELIQNVGNYIIHKKTSFNDLFHLSKCNIDNKSIYDNYIENQIEEIQSIQLDSSNQLQNIQQKYSTMENVQSSQILMDSKIFKELYQKCNFGSPEERTLNYYKNKLDYAKGEEKKDDDEIIAISSLIYEHEMKVLNGYDLFKKDLIKDESIQISPLFTSIGTKFVAENLIALNLYSYSYDYSDLNLLPQPSQEFIKKAFEYYSQKDIVFPFSLNVPFLVGQPVSINPSDIGLPLNHLIPVDPKSLNPHLKFITDFFKICFVLWFENLEENEKICILNQSYKLSLTDSNIDNYFNLFGKHDLSNPPFNNETLKDMGKRDLTDISLEIFYNGYYYEASNLFQYLFKKANSDIEKSYLLHYSSTCYTAINEYDSAIETSLEN
ncbi:hypothetical protein LJC08_01620 [Methanimicrococcus sp. OttesenSCG-928-J09]|nr:hypothetical protein [Methanimicrococcus sp. OttesenSCG-928-J09]